MPHLRKLAVDAEERGFSIIAISVDGTRLDEFKRREPNGVPFPVLLDCGKLVSERFGIGHVPTIVILDSEGKERFRHTGYPGNHVVLRELRKIESSPHAE
jgi:peroxiredoxin